jgi:nicotinamidase/pyrazinamidase
MKSKMSPLDFANAFRNGTLGDFTAEGLLGRIIRGKRPEDFRTLSDDPDRKIIILTDSDGLEGLVGVPGFSILLRIGWDYPYAVKKIQDGYKVKLVVFREGGPAQLATWDGMMTVVGLAYPDIKDRLAAWLPKLKIMSFAQINALYAGGMNKDVDAKGKNETAYMTYERYLQSADTVENARAFLYYAIHLRELYAGDGYTYRDSIAPENRGVKEYMAPNCDLSELLNCESVDFDVELPPSETKRTKVLPNAHGVFPSYYHPEDVGRFYIPRLDLVAAEASRWNLPPAYSDKFKRQLVGIDLQNDFVLPQILSADGRIIQRAGTLMVVNAVEDVRRVIEMIYTAPEMFTDMLWTLDQHMLFQIFYSAWWIDQDGNHPAPFTMISYDDVVSGKWRPISSTWKDWALKYTKTLQDTGQTPLIIWPEHCMIGTPGAAIVPALFEAIHWLSLVRKIQPNFMFKGSVAQTEHYGPFRACVKVDNNLQSHLNTHMLDMIAGHDEIVFVGEAEDFCVKQGMTQTMEYFGTKHPDVLKKIVFLRDCTSMVFPAQRAEADKFLANMSGQGIRISTSQELLAA